jgi:hypothetical protein
MPPTTRSSTTTTSPSYPELDTRKVRDVATLMFIDAQDNVSLLDRPGRFRDHGAQESCDEHGGGVLGLPSSCDVSRSTG